MASKINKLTGGAEENRTLDLLNAIQALSQLSYGPTGSLTGVSPATDRLCYRFHL